MCYRAYNEHSEGPSREAAEDLWEAEEDLQEAAVWWHHPQQLTFLNNQHNPLKTLK